jgi:hypothetical protein
VSVKQLTLLCTKQQLPTANPDLNNDRQAVPSRTTVLTFIVSIITATGITWLLVDFSLKNLVALFLSMLLAALSTFFGERGNSYRRAFARSPARRQDWVPDSRAPPLMAYLI